MSCTVQQAISAVRDLGVPVRLSESLHEGTFVEGAWIDGAEVVVFPPKALPGDVFHEAGHLAITPSAFRKYWRPTTNLEDPQSPLLQAIEDLWDNHLEDCLNESMLYRATMQMGECEATAWQYAATVHAGFDPKPMFGHPDRFEGDGLELAELLSHGYYLGVHGLQAAKMTTKKQYPRMLRWIQI